MGKIDRTISEQPMTIAERACLHGRTFLEEMEAILAEGRRFTPAEFGEISRHVRSLTPKGVEQTDSTDMIREMRDSNYGRS